jgi:hypothetical protein
MEIRRMSVSIRSLSAPAPFLAAMAVLLQAFLCTVFFAASPSRAGSDFVKELNASNAQHLAEKPVLEKGKKPATLQRDYDDKLKRESWQMSDKEISISITLTKGGPPDGMLFLTPVLSLSIGGKKVLRVEGSESFPDNPVFLVQIAEMDPGNPHKEVVFSTYTGGAHCCSDTRILTSSKNGKTWQEIELGPIDGGPLKVRDIDGDGRYEFGFRDNAFLYTFGCYACSTAPFLVLQLQDGKLIDASAKAEFRPHHVTSLQRIIEWAADDMDMNGFFAGYVAQKILLGEGPQAWKFMLEHYDKKSDWGLVTCSVKEDEKGECPPGKKVTLTFPQALERFYKDAGYKLTK